MSTRRELVFMFHDQNLAFILISAVLELWLVQHQVNCEYFFIFNLSYFPRSKLTRNSTCLLHSLTYGLSYYNNEDEKEYLLCVVLCAIATKISEYDDTDADEGELTMMARRSLRRRRSLNRRNNSDAALRAITDDGAESETDVRRGVSEGRNSID